MEMPEIQYQPEQVGVQFNPVTQADFTASMRQNHANTQRDMQERLQQMRANAAVELQNVRDQGFPVAELAQFSKTLEGFLQQRIDEKKEDDLAEGAALAFEEGFQGDPAFDAQEAQLKRDGEAITRRADAYEMKTGDVEGAENIRNLSGWKKYGYMKAKAEMAGNSFGSWMSANASNSEYAVNVGGQLYTLSNAPNAAIRQAVASKMATSYMQPYRGANRSFLGKYMFPGMQRGMSSAIASATAANAKLMKANRLDAAVTSFRGNPTPEGMMELDRVLRLEGMDNKTIRSHIVGEMTKVASDGDFEQLMNTPYGPNGKSFQEQYPQEAAELRVQRQQLLQRGVQAQEMARNTQDRQALEQARQAVQQDRADGSFDANPERLSELANAARAAGNTKTADFWESQISETAYMKESSRIKEQYESQMLYGAIPTQEEILQNPALSDDDKKSLLGQVASNSGKEPTSELAKAHKKILGDSIKQRGKWTRDGAADPGIAAMEYKAWKEYRQVYNNEIAAGATPDQAAQKALDDFNAKFGSDKNSGPYAIGGNDDGPGMRGKYLGYNRTGELSDAVKPSIQIGQKIQAGQSLQQIITAEGEMYDGEKTSLENLTKSFTTTGSIGQIPKAYYDLQQKAGGRNSIMDLVNARLRANGLDELPSDLTEALKPIEQSFDEDTYKYINYKPNATRTDIGMISSGQDPIYRAKIPNSVGADKEFQSAVSATAGRLGISEADLYAVMSFETGGTFDPGIRNAAGSGATGLIQFMPSTARGLGTSTQALAGMSRSQQMQYVEKYLRNAGVRPGANLSDLYMAVLFPAAVGKSDNFVLFGRGAMSGYTGVAYQQNRGLDSNGDGSVTKAEASAKVLRHREPASKVAPWRQPGNMRPELQ